MIQAGAIFESVQTLIGLTFLAFIALGILFTVRKIKEVRKKDDKYPDRITGVGDYPFDLQPDEEVLFDTRGRDISWKVVMLVGAAVCILGLVTIVFFFFIYWGVMLLIYANDQRKESDYVFTTKRLVELPRGKKAIEYDYTDVKQLQTGAAGYEKMINAGHLEFATGESHALHRIGAIRNPTDIAQRLEEGLSASAST